MVIQRKSYTLKEKRHLVRSVKAIHAAESKVSIRAACSEIGLAFGDCLFEGFEEGIKLMGRLV
jgi:hypothetical protein